MFRAWKMKKFKVEASKSALTTVMMVDSRPGKEALINIQGTNRPGPHAANITIPKKIPPSL